MVRRLDVLAFGTSSLILARFRWSGVLVVLRLLVLVIVHGESAIVGEHNMGGREGP